MKVRTYIHRGLSLFCECRFSFVVYRRPSALMVSHSLSSTAGKAAVSSSTLFERQIFQSHFVYWHQPHTFLPPPSSSTLLPFLRCCRGKGICYQLIFWRCTKISLVPFTTKACTPPSPSYSSFFLPGLATAILNLLGSVPSL